MSDNRMWKGWKSKPREVAKDCVLHKDIKHPEHRYYGLVITVEFDGYSHVYAYMKHHGLTAAEVKGMQFRHTCRERKCINPEHIEPIQRR